MSSTILAHGFIQYQERINTELQISDSAYLASGLFHVGPFGTQTSSASSSKWRESRISNQTVLPTSFRAVFCAKLRFNLALSHGGCMRTRRAFAVSACIHPPFTEGCGRP